MMEREPIGKNTMRVVRQTCIDRLCCSIAGKCRNLCCYSRGILSSQLPGRQNHRVYERTEITTLID